MTGTQVGHISDAPFSSSARAHSTQTAVSQETPAPLPVEIGAAAENGASEAAEGDFGDYWLPWHIDSNFITVLHKEMYAHESDASLAPEPEGAGLLVMNGHGKVAVAQVPDDAMVVQMGAFASIYSGGTLISGRHAVLSPRPPGIARFNYCNFWYVPWNTVCAPPTGFEDRAIARGWNSMMDDSYANITMRESFKAFRQFMVSPEARVQFADSVYFKELAELIPLPSAANSKAQAFAAALDKTVQTKELVIDVLTDVRCPFSYISHLNLEKALENLGLDKFATVRYHPIFLNPNVPKEGESLDDYLLRDYGYTKEYAHSENYPLRLQGLAVGVELNPNRRVVNTFDAFCLIDAAQGQGLQREVMHAISRLYFEQAEDISDEAVLRKAAEEAGLPADEARRAFEDLELRGRVWARYEELSAKVGEVPHFLLRDRISGNGADAGGNRSPEVWRAVLGEVIEKANFVGMQIPGPGGEPILLQEANPHSPVSLALNAQHGWSPESWPFSGQDFARVDETDDAAMYSEPRFVNHLDESSLERLQGVYRSILSTGKPGFAVLDLCSSWVSHFPQEVLDKQGARVVVHGLNELELKANSQASEWHVQNLNLDQRLPWQDESFDFVTLALSVQYLTQPQAVFEEMHRLLKPGGMAVVVFSHRAFFEKAVKLWSEEMYDGEGHAHVVCRYFQHSPNSGWKDLATVDASPRHGDPVWLVTAVKE